MSSNEDFGHRIDLIKKCRIFFSDEDFFNFLQNNGCKCAESTLSNIKPTKMTKELKDRIHGWYNIFEELLPKNLFASYEEYWKSLSDTHSFYNKHSRSFDKEDCLKTVLRYLYCKEQPQDWNKLCKDYDEQENKGKEIAPCLLFMMANDLLPKRRNEKRKGAKDFQNDTIAVLKQFTTGNRKCEDAIRQLYDEQVLNVLSLMNDIEKILQLYFKGSILSKNIGKPIEIDIVGYYHHKDRTDVFWHIKRSPYHKEEIGAYLFKRFKQNVNGWELSEYDVSALKDAEGNIVLAVSSPQMIRRSFENCGTPNVMEKEYFLFASTSTEKERSFLLKEFPKIDDGELKALIDMKFIQCQERKIEATIKNERKAPLVAFSREYFYLVIDSKKKVLRITMLDEEGEPTFPLFDKQTLEASITLCELNNVIYLKYDIDDNSMSLSITKLLETAKYSEAIELKVLDYNPDFWH